MSVKLILLFSVLFITNALSAQDTLLLMNGREMGCKIVSDSGTIFVFQLQKKNGKWKTREIHKSDVFSVTKVGEAEYVMYNQDEVFGNIYSVEEMRYYLAGQSDARNNFKAKPTFYIGLVTCGTIAFIGRDGFITAVVPPLIYTMVQLIPKIKIREKTMSDPNYKYNDVYADGYEPPARSRKIFRALEGGFGGSAAGVLAWFLFVKK